MKKKKILSILLSAALAVSLTACGNSNNASQTNENKTSTTQSAATDSTRLTENCARKEARMKAIR